MAVIIGEPDHYQQSRKSSKNEKELQFQVGVCLNWSERLLKGKLPQCVLELHLIIIFVIDLKNKLVVFSLHFLIIWSIKCQKIATIHSCII